jgi:hypothetical protein
MVKYLTFFLLFFSILTDNILAQNKPKTTTTEGFAQVELTKDKSQLQVENEAEKLATIDALERAFGKVVIQGNSTYVTNVNTGEKAESNSGFNMIADTYVKGEVIEILKKDFENIEGYKIVEGKQLKVTEIKCTIKLKAREKSESATQFEAYPLACDNPNCKSTQFKDGNDLFFYFLSPESGYLTMYIDDKTTAMRLLPYMNMSANYETGIPIKADKPYILFSNNEKHQYSFEKNIQVDRLELYSESQQDLNRIFVFFSKTPLTKPVLKENPNQNILSEMEKESGYKMPKSLDSEKFQHWIIKNKQIRQDLQMKVIDITISK